MIKIIIDLDSLEYISGWNGIMYFMVGDDFFPKKDCHCDPIDTISDLLEGAIELWRKHIQNTTADFIGNKELYDYPVHVEIKIIEDQPNWCIIFGEWDYDQSIMSTIVYTEIISPKILLKEIHRIATDIFYFCKSKGKYHEVLKLESLIKRASQWIN